MKRHVLRFGAAENITSRDNDGLVCRFRISVVDKELVGAPEEQLRTTQHKLEVEITDSCLKCWKQSDGDLAKVMYEIGMRTLKAIFEREGRLPERHKVNVDTRTFPELNCPFEPEKIKYAGGATVEFEYCPRIGFQAAATPVNN